MYIFRETQVGHGRDCAGDGDQPGGCGTSGTAGGSSPVDPPPVDPPPVDPSVEVPRVYSFESRFDAGESSVSYSGQTHRQILIKDMASFISSLTQDIDSGAFTPAEGDVSASLNYYFEFDSDTSSGDFIAVSTTPPLLQSTYGDISTNKDLVSKIAGNDEKGQHEDWSSAFQGWRGPGGDSPERLVRAFFDMLDERAVARVNGDTGLDPNGEPIPEVYVTPEGLDLKQLIEKFLLMAVNYSQGTDDYLDNDLENHGINSQNVERGSDTASYTSLEHIWDEGFGYFGSAVTTPSTAMTRRPEKTAAPRTRRATMTRTGTARSICGPRSTFTHR